MTHEELLKEADRISANKLEAKNTAFQFLRNQESEKLNHTKVFKDIVNQAWYIPELNNQSIPFGFVGVDYLNQLFCLKSKEAFMNFERRIRSGASSEKAINPTFDKPYRFFIWGFDEELYRKNAFNSYDKLSDEELESLYDSVSWLWEYVGKEISELEEYLKNYIKLPESEKKKYVIQTYNHIRYLIIYIYKLQCQSSVLNKSIDDDYLNGIVQECKNTAADLDFIEKLTNNMIRFMGYEELTMNEENVICEKYDIPNLLYLMQEDIMLLLMDNISYKFKFCSNCGCLFVVTNGNQKFCSACSDNRPKILNSKRKENKARYLHKQITDYLNLHTEDGSADFRNESNYYWSVVQGKPKKKLQGYSSKIKTESDYIAWLEKKFESIKK